LSQVALVAALDPSLGVAQSSVSDFERGERMPSLEQMEAIEQAAGRPAGFILRLAGYLPEPDTGWSIDTDPALDDGGRRALRASYDALVAMGEQL
jgi:transcriptional regulator with XRE-family HTH domain